MTQPTPQKTFRQTTTAKLARARLARTMQSLDHDEGLWWKIQEIAPEAWATLEEDIWCEEKKVKLTLRLDASVASFYRAMGKGYQARMNRVLATFAQMRIGEVERQRADEMALFERFGPELPQEIAKVWHAIRDKLPEDAPIDRDRLDRWLGT